MLHSQGWDYLTELKDTQGPIQDYNGKYTTNVVYNEVLN